MTSTVCSSSDGPWLANMLLFQVPREAVVQPVFTYVASSGFRTLLLSGGRKDGRTSCSRRQQGPSHCWQWPWTHSAVSEQCVKRLPHCLKGFTHPPLVRSLWILAWKGSIHILRVKSKSEQNSKSALGPQDPERPQWLSFHSPPLPLTAPQPHSLYWSFWSAGSPCLLHVVPSAWHT